MNYFISIQFCEQAKPSCIVSRGRNKSNIKNNKLYKQYNMNQSFIQTDDNKIINERCIVWVKKMNECLEVCTKITGCEVRNGTHQICKLNSPSSYAKLNAHFN